LFKCGDAANQNPNDKRFPPFVRKGEQKKEMQAAERAHSEIEEKLICQGVFFFPPLSCTTLKTNERIQLIPSSLLFVFLYVGIFVLVIL
jgi:hypothetical protein